MGPPGWAARPRPWRTLIQDTGGFQGEAADKRVARESGGQMTFPWGGGALTLLRCESGPPQGSSRSCSRTNAGWLLVSEGEKVLHSRPPESLGPTWPCFVCTISFPFIWSPQRGPLPAAHFRLPSRSLPPSPRALLLFTSRWGAEPQAAQPPPLLSAISHASVLSLEPLRGVGGDPSPVSGCSSLHISERLGETLMRC